MPTESHRAKIRKAFVTRLAGKTASNVFRTSAEDRVYDSRLRPLRPNQLPAILVYARSETADPESKPKDGHGGAITRDLRLAVECVVKGKEDVDDILDQFTQEVEDALEWFEIPGYETAAINLTDTEITVDTDGEQPIGGARLTFSVRYRSPWRLGEPEDAEPAPPMPSAPRSSGGPDGAGRGDYKDVTR